MAILHPGQFENHMDVVSPETVGDAEKMLDFFEKNPYDEFEARLSQAEKSVIPKEYTESVDKDNIVENKIAKSGENQKVFFKENVNDLSMKPADSSSYPPVNVNDEKLHETIDSSTTADSGKNDRYHYRIQQMSEKIIAVFSMAESVNDLLSGGMTAIEQTNKKNIEDLFSETSIVSSEGHHDTRSIHEVIREQGFEIGGQEKEIIEDAIIDVGQAIDSIGNDSDNLAEYIAEHSKYNPDNKITTNTNIKAEGTYTESERQFSSMNQLMLEHSKHLVFQAIADANPDYGDGGGKQYFIQRASELKEDGSLKLQSQMVLNFDEREVFKADIRNFADLSQDVHFDNRNMTAEAIEQILNVSSDKSTGSLGDIPGDISEEELRYLDDNTIATEGLTHLEYEAEPNGKKHEDRLTPLGNQEDSNGKNHPDSWGNPEELELGKVYYQISPIFSDGNSATKSSYFTDEKTINLCKDENGMISASALLQKLQIEPKKEILTTGDGNSKEEYVKRYMLSSFIFAGKEEK